MLIQDLPVAVKCFTKARLKRASSKKLLEREVKIMKELDHPNVRLQVALLKS